MKRKAVDNGSIQLERTLCELEDAGGVTREYASAVRAAMTRIDFMERNAIRMVREGATVAEIIAMARTETAGAQQLLNDFLVLYVARYANPPAPTLH